MYYVIETSCVNSNQSDTTTIEICESPAHKNMSGEVCINGWAGTTNNWSVDAHGEYETVEAARASINKQFGEVRDADNNGESFEPNRMDAVEVYKLGKYTPMSAAESEDWVYPAMETDINIATSDEKLAELAVSYEAMANDEGYALSDVADTLEKYRDEKREEIDADIFDDDAVVVDVFGQGSHTSTKKGVEGFQVDFDVEVSGKAFHIVFQSEDRSDNIKAYNGHEMQRATIYGCDSDESEELLELLEHDYSLINYLEGRAAQLCKEWLNDQQ